MKKEAKFKEGEIVFVKDYESLKEEAEKYPYLMEVKKLKDISCRLLCVYKVIPCGNDFWYEIGQWGHNIIKVPESFIISENKFYTIKHEEEKIHKLSSFTLRDFIESGRRLNSIIKESEDYIRDYKFEKEQTDEEIASIVFVKPDVSLEFIRNGIYIPSGRTIKGVFIRKEEQEYTFENEAQRLLNNFKNHSGSMDVIRLKACLTSCIALYYNLYSSSINNPNDYNSKFALITLANYAVELICLYRGEPYGKKVFPSVIITEMIDLHHKKNADYGNSFDKSLDEDGLLVAKIRIGDKVNRFLTLTSKKTQEAKVSDESIEDTLIDLANYCLMTIVWMKNNNPNKK